MNERVNHPKHYRPGRFEAIKVIEAWNLNFHLGNAVKYICRTAESIEITDLEKARWYIDREIKRRNER